MRVLALLVALISMPVLAADYTPWPDRDAQCFAGEQLAQAESGQKPKSGQATPEPRHPGDYCCVHCRRDEIPCGGKCLAKKGNTKLVCMEKRTCACPGKP